MSYLDLAERKAYVTRHECEQAYIDNLIKNVPLLYIGPFKEGSIAPMKRGPSMENYPDFLVMFDPANFTQRVEHSFTYALIDYTRGFEFQIPRPLAKPDKGPMLDVTSGTIAAIINNEKFHSLFYISPKMRQLIGL